MNTFTKTLITLAMILAVLVLAPAATAQTAVSTTTLGAALTAANCSALTVAFASTTGMLSAGTQNNPNTVVYVDTEYMWVNQVIDSTHASVTRCHGGLGEGSIPRAHINGATVWFQNTSAPNPAASFSFKNEQPTAEAYGACTATLLLGTPIVYLQTGDVFQCYNGSSGGQWIKVGVGTMNASTGRQLSNFCTGSLGSAETEYLNGAACSGATTATARLLVTTPGVLANLYVVAGTNVTGGTNKDVLTVYKNGSATTITCTFATGGAATTCSDTSHSVATVPGDVITFQFVTATSDTGANIGASVGLY